MARWQMHTSERVTREAYLRDPNDYLVYCMHEATYSFARQHARRGYVLDFGCGTGYGAALLAPDVTRIVGVDISEEAIAEASRLDTPGNVSFQQIPPIEQAPLPHDNDAFDTVLSFQVIEHVPDVDRYLDEIRRVLRPGGSFVCATPDRTVRLFPRQRPWNIFHVAEFAPDQLADLLRDRFDDVEVYGMASTPPGLLDIELRRYRTMRAVSLPFTFPGVPEGWRRAGLQVMKRLKGLVARREQIDDGVARHGYGPEAIRVEPGRTGTPNVLAVAR